MSLVQSKLLDRLLKIREHARWSMIIHIGQSIVAQLLCMVDCLFLCNIE